MAGTIIDTYWKCIADPENEVENFEQIDFQFRPSGTTEYVTYFTGDEPNVIEGGTWKRTSCSDIELATSDDLKRERDQVEWRDIVVTDSGFTAVLDVDLLAADSSTNYKFNCTKVTE